MTKKIIITVTSIILLVLLALSLLFYLSFHQARNSAEQYLQIMTIRDEESYQRVKNSIYHISTEEVRDIVFKNDHYQGVHYPKIEYKVNYVRCIEIKGFRHFVFEIQFTVKNWRTIESIAYVENNIVYRTHRKD